MRQRRFIRAVFAFGIAALPVLANECPKPVSLSGEWAFRLDPKQEGVVQKWFETALPDRIKLPGTTDEAKLGIANTNKPMLMGLCRPNTYAGPAWYQREIVIPAAWAGKRITLLLERVHWETRVWIDGQSAGEPQESLVTPHRHELGVLTPGNHRLTICVDNTIKFDLGQFVSIYSEHTQGNWNGIVGRIELIAHDPVHLADVQVYPDAAARKARVSATLANASGKSGQGSVSVAVSERGGSTVAEKKADVTWDDKGGRVDIELALGIQAKLWDEFHPNLYDVTVTLTTQAGAADSRLVCFGLRDFGIKGRQFTVNGRPIYLRGDVDCAIFPLTGYPAMEVKDWRRIMRTVKSYGLNHIRFHSWTPPEAAFTAADEAGIMFQVEGPQANVAQGDDLSRDTFIAREIARIQAVYGNHPSFCLLTMGNELGGKADVVERLVAEAVQRDQRHLCSSVSNGFGTDTSNSQFKVPMKVRGIHGEGTASDFAGAIAGYPRPQISHEVGQWQVFPNFREMGKYTGVLELRNFALIRDHLARNGLLDLAPRYVEATGRHAALLYKEEVEVLLRTPDHAGIQLLSLRDYPGTGTALVGLLDPFWDSKGLITPEAFQRFCGPTVPLLRFPKRTWTEEESFAAEAELAHFGETDLAAVTPVWSIKDEHGRELATGVLPVIAAKTGTRTKLGRIEASLAGAKAPCKLTVTLKLKGTACANDWEIWAYPSPKQKPEPPADIVVSQGWDELTRSALASGKKVLLLADISGQSRVPGTLSEKWDDAVKHAAQEARRLGLRFTMHNCPGWATAGGPWVSTSNAMRSLVLSRTDVQGATPISLVLPQPQPNTEPWRDYRDIAVLAFPTPLGDTNEPLKPLSVRSNREDLPWLECLSGELADKFNLAPCLPNTPTWVEVTFEKPVTLRSLELSSVRRMNHGWCYDPGVTVTLQARVKDSFETLLVSELPAANFQDTQPITLAVSEVSSPVYRILIANQHDLALSFIRLRSAARQNNWESEACWTLRAIERSCASPRQSREAWLEAPAVTDLTSRMDPQGRLTWTPPRNTAWTILRVGHVNAGRKNWPAPEEATGWECDKLSQAGPDAHFAGYIGRLTHATGPLANNLLNGMLIDSWECNAQTWTHRMEAEFQRHSGYPLRAWLPALFGYVIKDLETTSRFLRDWRATINDLVGKGRVITGLPLEQALLHPELGLTPDVTGGEALWLHRRTAGADWYFVCPPAGQAFKGTLSFRSAGVVELWDPVTGQVRRIPGQRDGARTRAALDLAQAESCFVVFRHDITADGPPALVPAEPRQLLALDGPWTLHFPEGWGAPESLKLGKLMAWKDLPISPEGRAFSGTATYTTTFTLPDLQAEGGYQLDLGTVDMTARVTLNGKSLGLLWCEPYTLDISGALQQGENQLTVEVTSTWHNRLVHDAGLPEDERKTWTIEGPKKEASLSRSGLLGPVVIRTAEGRLPGKPLDSGNGRNIRTGKSDLVLGASPEDQP